jgi:hypothetical protein
MIVWWVAMWRKFYVSNNAARDKFLQQLQCASALNKFVHMLPWNPGWRIGLTFSTVNFQFGGARFIG